jgi:hypothetical protein
MTERVRVLVELGGVLYTIGMIRSTSRTLALRRLGDRYADELAPFVSLRAARQTCQALGQARIVRFPPGDGVANQPVRGRRTRRRRRMPRMPVETAPMSAARPSAPPDPPVAPSPSPPSHEAPRRTFTRDRRPTPETMVALNAALDRLETQTP